ncbi:MAG: hypothetical protein VX638_13275 [Chloroflexota bacterium]|nr:hypothetical protein [Chloroflexota bacterium]
MGCLHGYRPTDIAINRLVAAGFAVGPATINGKVRNLGGGAEREGAYGVRRYPKPPTRRVTSV